MKELLNKITRRYGYVYTMNDDGSVFESDGIDGSFKHDNIVVALKEWLPVLQTTEKCAGDEWIEGAISFIKNI